MVVAGKMPSAQDILCTVQTAIYLTAALPLFIVEETLSRFKPSSYYLMNTSVVSFVIGLNVFPGIENRA
jgi:hypothetical protein